MAACKTELVSVFPPGYFLENIASLAHGGLLVTVANRSELYFVPPSNNGLSSPVLLQKFAPDQMTFGIVRAPQNPNIFYILTSDFLSLGRRQAQLQMLDLSDAAHGCVAKPIMTFPPEAAGLNGLCALSDSVLLAADSFASRIWRIDLDITSSFPPKIANAITWCTDKTMDGKLVLPDFQPGVNGIKYSAVTSHVYYTSTQQKLFCRVPVNPETLQPSGNVEVISRGMQGDDLILDDAASPPVAYVTTHRDNTILRIPLNSTGEIALNDLEVMARGTTDDDKVVGPTAGTWQYGSTGKVAYFLGDGGLKNPLEDGIIRCAKVVRLVF